MAVYIHTSILERLDDAEFDLIIQSRVQQDCFGGIAHRATASLAVHSHRDGLVNICGGINVEMTIAVPVSIVGTVAPVTTALMRPAPPRGITRSTSPRAVMRSCTESCDSHGKS